VPGAPHDQIKGQPTRLSFLFYLLIFAALPADIRLIPIRMRGRLTAGKYTGAGSAKSFGNV